MVLSKDARVCCEATFIKIIHDNAGVSCGALCTTMTHNHAVLICGAREAAQKRPSCYCARAKCSWPVCPLVRKQTCTARADELARFLLRVCWQHAWGIAGMGLWREAKLCHARMHACVIRGAHPIAGSMPGVLRVWATGVKYARPCSQQPGPLLAQLCDK
eukprot:1160978-Pelagomonas_calceolata.AAC.2